MSTVSKSGPKKSRKTDPFRYGWRYVRVKSPDGTVTYDQVPLTEEDVLFPKVGDFIVQTDGHIEDVVYLRTVSKAQLAGDPTAVVVSDCRVEWNLRGVRPLGPDVAVFFGVNRRDDWGTFNVRVEGAIPKLVIEVTSQTTRKNDLGKKVAFYHRAKVPLYLIADARGRGAKRRIELIAYQYTPEKYERIAPNAQGRIYLEAVRLWIGVTRDRQTGFERLACYDPKTGAEVGDYTALKQANERAEAEALEAKRQVRVQAKRAETEARRAEAEARRAETEAEARAAAEARIRELEAELKRSHGRGR